ncbi:MAG TPA: FAD-binding protein [Propionibacteriaceae bacterium]|nr:FAD-binding protein [Propionibacteriaceae bacterium]
MSAVESIVVDGYEIPVMTANTVVVGTGSAGYCAADRLAMFGQTDVIVVSDKIRAGASRNAGSDKQTYYKLTLSGAEPDSVRDMAQTLFSGGAMDGDIALAEAAWSARAFFHLVESGVPFPHARSGEFVGYKTDHDPRQRATSVGPFTSKSMTESLERRVQELHKIPVIDACRVVDLVVDDGRVVGLLCLKTDVRDNSDESRFLLLRCTNLVYATGGPAGMYADAVYPHGQWGANGAPLRAGVRGKNLTEWQFGLASTKPRWNVSGTYMQVVPRFVSTDADGGDEREFLDEAIDDYGRLISLVFLKGYQWPFDIRKARSGSSLVDLLVYRETVLRGRRVFLDFRSNPRGHWDPMALAPEAYEYLERAGVLGLGDSTPIQRLQHMNRPAYEFYLGRNPGVDLEKDLLEIAVCAQHNNGGLWVDQWWHSNLEGLFPVGEAAGAHGVYRPGGAALNSGQVGATRAATYIAERRRAEPVSAERFSAAAHGVVSDAVALLRGATERAETMPDTTDALLREATELMSSHAGVVRSRQSIADALVRVKGWLDAYSSTSAAAAGSRRSVNRLFLIRDILTSQYVYLSAMADYLDHGGRSRGSVLYTDASGTLPLAGEDGPELDLPEVFRFSLEDGLADVIQETGMSSHGDLSFAWRPVRPIPEDDEFFENVWRHYRDDKNVY